MFLILFFPLSLFASILQMQGLQWYELNYSADEIRLVTNAESISIRKKECTEKMIGPFLESMEKIVKGKELRKGENDIHVNLILDGKKFFVPRRGRAAAYLKNVPHELRKMLIEENFRCEKAPLKQGQKAL